ncbi:MAG: trypsin-like peptidase domain-containing protein [Planctomycetes bacterium]|nr:trypsin-like peptidase domain-containing protein [Planctomycetota bacterium]
MTIRINCPSCETPNTVDESKRGMKMRCRSCKEPFTVPAAKKKVTEAVQSGTKLKTKSANARKQADDDDDDATPAPKKKGGGILLLVGGVAVVLLFLLCGGGGVGGFFLYRHFSNKETPLEPQVAQNSKKDDPKGANPNPNDKGDGEPKKKTDAKPNDKQDDKKDPNPKIDPDPKKNPDPMIDPEPKKKKTKKTDPDPDPTPITKEDPLPPALEKVRQATVLVRALRPDGKWIEGSGFVVQPSVIVTNAHVLGLLDTTVPPNGTEVVFNPGTKDERKVGAGYVIDRSTDLAIMQVAKNIPLPEPLTFEEASKIGQTQKVHIFGFPNLPQRKSPSVSNTEIVNVKKDGGGALEMIQVGGGMSPGSSGGPVVNADGKVVGVALGVIKEADMHLAVSPEVINRVLIGKIGAGTFGGTRALPGNKTVIFYQAPVIDPLSKVQSARVDVWTGSPTVGRPYSYQPPSMAPGDSARTSQNLMIQGSIATNELLVPEAVAAGQVVWVQPVISLKDGTTQWGVAAQMPMAFPAPKTKSEYDLKPANLTYNFEKPKDRTVSLKYTLKATTPTGPGVFKSSADILEVMTALPDGGLMKTGFGSISAEVELAGKSQPIPKELIDLVKTVPTIYTFDSTGKVKNRDYRVLPNTVPKELQEGVFGMLLQTGSMYEATFAPMPNKEMQPGDKWTSTLPIVFRAKQKTGIVELAMNNTYEGTQGKRIRRDGIITVTGKLRATDAELKQFDGDLTGKIAFDIKDGYIHSADLKVVSVPTAADADKYTLEIELKRMNGNPLKISVPADSIAKVDPKKGDPKGGKQKPALDKRASLNGFDPVDTTITLPMKKKAHYQRFAVNLEAGKTYVIQLNTTAFAPLIKVQAPNNSFVGQGIGQIMFRPTVSGQFHVVAVSGDGRQGGFHIIVQEQ